MMKVAFTLADLVGSGCDVEYHLVSQTSCHASNKESWRRKGLYFSFSGQGSFPILLPFRSIVGRVHSS